MSIFLDSGVKIDLAGTEQAEPKWHLLFPLGVTKHRADFGKITFDAPTLKAMADNYAAEGKPERAVNYFHLGPSSVPAPIEAKVASGWIKDVELREDGLYALIAWTERARGFIQRDELRYLSPEFRLSITNKKTGKDQGPTLLGAALLNDPFLTELPRVAASETADSNVGKDNNMEQLKKLLKLGEAATETDVEKAVEALLAKDVQMSESATKLAEVEGMVTKLQEQIGELSKERDSLVAEKKATEVKAFVDGLVRSGKVAPSIRANVEQLGMSNGLEAIKFFEASPAVVQMGEKGITGEAAPQDEKAEAKKRFDAKLAELEAKGLKFTEAFAEAKRENGKDFELVYAAR